MQYSDNEAALHWDMIAMKDLGRALTLEDNGEVPVENRPQRAFIVTFGGDKCFGPNTADRCEVYISGMQMAIHRLEREARLNA